MRYFRARHITSIALLSVLVAGATLAWGTISVPTQGSDEFGVPVRMQLGLIISVVFAWFTSVGMSSHYPSDESLSTRHLWGYRLTHVLLAVAGFTILAIAATSTLDGTPGTSGAVRNYLLLAGLGLASAPLVGPRLSWILPSAVMMFYATLGSGLSHNPLRVPLDDYPVLVASGLSIVGGTWLYCAMRPRLP